MRVKNLKLNNEAEIPIIGFGTWKLTGEEGKKAVAQALEIGYRHIDTASRYDNHKEVGEAIKESGIPRKELFVVSKLWRDNLRHDDTIHEFEQSLRELQLDYIDLYLIHWPNKEVPVSETLNALNELKQQGRIKAIGVSNFTVNHLKEALETDVEITNNQIEFHPSLNQWELKEFCDQHNIVVTAYSPITHDIDIPEIKEIAAKYNASPAQVILAWLMSKNIVVIPQSANPEHMKSNLESTDLQLDEQDMENIDSLNSDNRVNMPGYHEFDY